MRRVVLLAKGGLQAGLPGAATLLRLRPTREQRTPATLPVSDVAFADFDGTPPGAVPGLPSGRSSAAVYVPATARLARGPAATSHYFLSFVNGLPGHEAEYDRWYLAHHLHEVLEAQDFVAAQRFTLERTLHEELLPPFRFMAVYELATRDLAGSIAALEARLTSGVMTETPYKDPSRRLQLFAENVP